ADDQHECMQTIYLFGNAGDRRLKVVSALGQHTLCGEQQWCRNCQATRNTHLPILMWTCYGKSRRKPLLTTDARPTTHRSANAAPPFQSRVRSTKGRGALPPLKYRVRAPLRLLEPIMP